jgi:hypothetical protein
MQRPSCGAASGRSTASWFRRFLPLTLALIATGSALVGPVAGASAAPAERHVLYIAAASNRANPETFVTAPPATPTARPEEGMTQPAPTQPPSHEPTQAPAAPTATPTATAPAADGFMFGTLLSDPSRTDAAREAGARVVHLELGWDAYEPREGEFDAAYAAEAKRKLQAYRAAGMRVVLGVGLQYPPRWVFSYPNSGYVNQHGARAEVLNLTFNQALRERAERYVARVAQDLGPGSFWAVRVGSGGNIESLYPSHDATGTPNSYWAYDAAAQGGPGRPPTVPPPPMPGWKPGQTTHAGRPVTPAQVGAWYEWYLGAMVDGIDWQIATYKRLGYTGYMQVLMPGIGTRPHDYDVAVAHYLDGTGDGNRTMGRAAAWHRVADRLADKARVVLYVSSLADGSGRDDLCQPGDRAVGLDDRAVEAWSAARWVSYNADRHGLAKMGENPGRSDTNAYGKAMLERAAQQASSCGMQGLMWAHESNLVDGASGVTMADYASVIARYPR